METSAKVDGIDTKTKLVETFVESFQSLHVSTIRTLKLLPRLKGRGNGDFNAPGPAQAVFSTIGKISMRKTLEKMESWR